MSRIAAMIAAGGQRILKTSVVRCHTRRSTAAYLYKHVACSRISCLVIFDRGARCVVPSRLIRMTIDGDISRISSQSLSDQRRLEIGRCLAIGKAIRCAGRDSYIATLVQSHMRCVMLAKVTGKDTQTIASALIKQAEKLPKELHKFLTQDRGRELTDHRRFTSAPIREISQRADPHQKERPPSGGLSNPTLRTDQAAARTVPFRLRRYPKKPSTPRPRSIIPHVAGKGVAAVMDKLPSATQFEQTPANPKLANKYPAPLTADSQASEVPIPKACPIGAKILA